MTLMQLLLKWFTVLFVFHTKNSLTPSEEIDPPRYAPTKEETNNRVSPSNGNNYTNCKDMSSFFFFPTKSDFRYFIQVAITTCLDVTSSSVPMFSNRLISINKRKKKHTGFHNFSSSNKQTVFLVHSALMTPISGTSMHSTKKTNTKKRDRN